MATSRRCSSPRAHIVELKLTSGRHSGVPLETRGAIGRYDASRDVLELHGAAKVPHRNKELIARMLNRAPSSVQCFESHVGGGFGIRGEIYPEDMLVCVAAMRFERPVKWIEDRREHLIAANHSRNQHHHIKAAVHRRRRNPRHRRRDLSRQRRLCAHPRHPRRDDDLRRAARAVSRAGRLSRGLPFPADQQDAGRDLSRAGALRDHLRARAAGRRHRASASARSDPRAAAQRRHGRRDAVQAAARGAGRGNPFRLRRLSRAARHDARATSNGPSSTTSSLRRRENGEMVGVGLAMFVEKAGLGPGRRRAHPGRYLGRRSR